MYSVQTEGPSVDPQQACRPTLVVSVLGSGGRREKPCARKQDGERLRQTWIFGIKHTHCVHTQTYWHQEREGEREGVISV